MLLVGFFDFVGGEFGIVGFGVVVDFVGGVVGLVEVVVCVGLFGLWCLGVVLLGIVVWFVGFLWCVL